MVNLKEKLISRKKYIESVITSLKHVVTEQNESIYVRKHSNGFQYYRKTDAGNTYIKKGDNELVRNIVQAEYNNKVLKAAELELKKLNSLINVYDNDVAENVYNQMPTGKKVIINPIQISEEEFIKEWNQMQYEKFPFREDAPEFYTFKGERVRSKSEVIIANLLDKMNVNYKYEKPLKLEKLGIVHPDFTLLDVINRKEIYLEHLGMIDDEVYRNNAVTKIRAYERNGYYMGDRLIVTAETVNSPLDIKLVEKKIRAILRC